jgi:hypothetical protein
MSPICAWNRRPGRLQLAHVDRDLGAILHVVDTAHASPHLLAISDDDELEAVNVSAVELGRRAAKLAKSCRGDTARSSAADRRAGSRPRESELARRRHERGRWRPCVRPPVCAAISAFSPASIRCAAVWPRTVALKFTSIRVAPPIAEMLLRGYPSPLSAHPLKDFYAPKFFFVAPFPVLLTLKSIHCLWLDCRLTLRVHQRDDHGPLLVVQHHVTQHGSGRRIPSLSRVQSRPRGVPEVPPHFR